MYYYYGHINTIMIFNKLYRVKLTPRERVAPLNSSRAVERKL